MDSIPTRSRFHCRGFFFAVAQVMFLSGLMAAGADSVGPNLVADGDFDREGLRLVRTQEPGEWIVHGLVAPDIEVKIADGVGRNGTRGLRYHRTGDSKANVHADQTVPVHKNTVYEVSAFVRWEGKLRPILAVTRMDWKSLGMVVCEEGRDWTEVRFAFNSYDNEQVRLEWFGGATGELYTSAPGTSCLDDVSLRAVTDPPDYLRTAFEVSRPKADREISPAQRRGGAVGAPKPLRTIVCRDGVLRYKDGGEVALWGVNMQTALSWEYNTRLKFSGVPLEAEALKQITDQNLDQLELMGAQVIRAHLLPSDFTDAEGNLRDTIFLDALDHLIARCRQRGIYIYMTLANDMNTYYCPDSFMAGRDIRQWLFDDPFVTRLERYIQGLLNHRNRYTGQPYRDEPAIAVFEVINEPRYLRYSDLAGDPACAAYRQAFGQWCAGRGIKENQSACFRTYRYERVCSVVDRLAKAIRDTGARKPVVWNLNWPQMILEHEDVFQALADSTVDAVSFCCYPGQRDVPNPYWNHPMDLSDRNYLPYLRDCYARYEWLRWLLGERFAHKAKVTYEFETFYNTTGYLYPAMARLFRALGSQMAMVWQYTLTPAASYCTGSHYLNVEGSPQKAASFRVAMRAFGEMPRGVDYDTAAKTEMARGHWAVSFDRNLSVFSDERSLIYSNSFEHPPLPIGAHVREIVGWGCSPLASYEGTGAYFVQVGNDHIDLQILPDVAYLRPLWQGRGRVPLKPACKFDNQTPHRFSLHLPGWEGRLKIQNLDDNSKEAGTTAGGAFDIIPGRYRLVHAKE
jgi:hypothetical protein